MEYCQAYIIGVVKVIDHQNDRVLLSDCRKQLVKSFCQANAGTFTLAIGSFGDGWEIADVPLEPFGKVRRAPEEMSLKRPDGRGVRV